ncbi:MAG: 2-oxoacid:acceptor oxidoreductase family protein [Deltaproteobacteria bacterium]|nr:2-oxoacid:acceptor oxidoreductase family protein [Deltaproteobacteria bacterium]
MSTLELSADPTILARRHQGLLALGRAVQQASRGRLAFTWRGTRLGDLSEEALAGLDQVRAMALIESLLEESLEPGRLVLERLLELEAEGLSGAALLRAYAERDLASVARQVVSRIEGRQLKVLLLGSAGTGVVSAVQDMVEAFTSAGYYGRAFPLFDPSKKGAPVQGYAIVSAEPILSHAPFEAPNIVLLFDYKLLPLLRRLLASYRGLRAEELSLVVNAAATPGDFRLAADFYDPVALHTVDAEALVRGRRIPPNYAMLGALLGVLGEGAADVPAFTRVVQSSLTQKFGPGAKVDTNLEVLEAARTSVQAEPGQRARTLGLGAIQPLVVPPGQTALFEDGNRAIARAVAAVLNLYPSVVAAYPITPQTQIAEHLAQMIADGTLSAEGVTPESEHGAGGAVMGAARDRVLAFTATCSQGFALMSEVVHSIAGLRMGNVVISNVLRSLNSPLDVENDHSDLNKVGLDAGFVVLMTRDVQQGADFHLLAYLIGMYAEYRRVEQNGHGGQLELVPDRSVMLPVIVASEGFEVSHAPERYFALSEEQVRRFYEDPAFAYVRTFVDTPNRSIMGALQLSNARMDTDYQRHLAMERALEVIPRVFEKFAELSGRRYGFVHAYNLEASQVVFVVAGAANGTFEEVAREFARAGIQVAVVHPNVLRPFPRDAWAEVLRGRKVFVYDRDDPFGATGGRLYTDLAGVVNELGLAESGTRLYSRIHGLGGRTPTLSQVRDELLRALRDEAGELELRRGKEYVEVNL